MVLHTVVVCVCYDDTWYSVGGVRCTACGGVYCGGVLCCGVWYSVVWYTVMGVSVGDVVCVVATLVGLVMWCDRVWYCVVGVVWWCDMYSGACVAVCVMVVWGPLVVIVVVACGGVCGV